MWAAYIPSQQGSEAGDVWEYLDQAWGCDNVGPLDAVHEGVARVVLLDPLPHGLVREPVHVAPERQARAPLPKARRKLPHRS